MKKAIICINGVETLDFFSKQIKEELEKRKIKVFGLDLKNLKKSLKKMQKFIEPRQTTLITFNFEGLEREEYIYNEKNKRYVWQELKVICINIVVDHPYYYYDRLNDLIEDFSADNYFDNYLHVSIDKKHKCYMKQYYKIIKNNEFLPLAGTKIFNEEDRGSEYQNTKVQCDENKNINKKIKDRKIDIVFAGNYTPEYEFEKNINWINEEYAEFYRDIIETLKEKTDKTFEEIAHKKCVKTLGNIKDEDFINVMNKMIFIDLYIRNYYRGKAVKEIVMSDHKIVVIGKGWEKLKKDIPCDKWKNIKHIKQTNTEECLKLIADAKISLNVMPWFKDGAHDRVFSSILNGAVCLTDSSKYLEKELKNEEGVIYFKLNEEKNIGEIIDKYDDSRLQKIVDDGNKKVIEKHRWNKRTEKIIEMEEKLRENSKS